MDVFKVTKRDIEEITRAKWYKIMNRVTGEIREVMAFSAHEACRKCGWMVGDCYIKELHKEV